MPRLARSASITAGAIAVAVGLSSLGGGVAVAAGGGLAPPAVDPASVHRPSAAPDRVILTPTETPATSQAVTWRTATAVTSPRVEWALSGPSVVEGAQSVAATSTTSFDTTLGYDVAFHTATIADLEPGTTYVYRVGDGETWTEWFEFRTATTAAGDFSFVMLGDAQNDNKAYTSRAFRAAFEARPYAKLAVHAGDLIDTETSDAEWGEWNGAGALMNQYANLIATPGNHEYYPGPDLTEYWPAQFAFPHNGPGVAELEETVYFVDYQGVRFISLNTNRQNGEPFAAQTAWLEGVLEDNPNEWTVVTFHHPVFSTSGDRDNAVVRNAWLPILEEHDVDLVLQGHDHTYGRGNLVVNEQNLPEGADPAKSHTGPVYMVTVAGPKDYGLSPDGQDNWTLNDAHLRVKGANLQLFQTVDVTDDGRMHVEARTVDGALFDAFTITKDAAGGKLVTDDVAWTGGPGSTRDGVDAPALPGDPGTDPGADPGTDAGTDPGTDPDGDKPTASVSDTTVAPGDTVSVTAAGFKAGEQVAIELRSTPVTLARVTADAAGALTASVTIPVDTRPGAHSIVLTGVDSTRSVSVAITVEAAPAGARPGQLPATGGALPLTLMILGGVLVAGGGAVVIRSVLRNRKAS